MRWVWRYLVGTMVLAGCSTAVSPKAGYVEAVGRCLEATQAWVADSKNQVKLNKAQSLCANAESEFANGPEASRRSYLELKTLRGCLDMARTVLQDGGDPMSQGSFDISPYDSVRNEAVITKNRLDEEIDRSARPSASPTP